LYHSSFINSFEGLNKERLDRNQWKHYQNLMQDSPKFVELMQNIDLTDGLQPEMAQLVESYLMKGKDGQLGITGEGLLLENAKDTNIPAGKLSESGNSKGITISAARYASEDAATLVHYVIAILEYSKMCGPLRLAKDRVEQLKREQAEYEKRMSEKEAEVIEF